MILTFSCARVSSHRCCCVQHNRRLDDFSAGFILGIEPPQQHTMFEFDTLEDIDQFEINTDRVMGGGYTDFLHSPGDNGACCAQGPACALLAFSRRTRGRTRHFKEYSTTDVMNLAAKVLDFAHFARRCVQGGGTRCSPETAALSQPSSRFHFLRSFDAIEMLVKTDGRPYMLYLKEMPSDSRRADDVFQAYVCE